AGGSTCRAVRKMGSIKLFLPAWSASSAKITGPLGDAMTVKGGRTRTLGSTSKSPADSARAIIPSVRSIVRTPSCKGRSFLPDVHFGKHGTKHKLRTIAKRDSLRGAGITGEELGGVKEVFFAQHAR